MNRVSEPVLADLAALLKERVGLNVRADGHAALRLAVAARLDELAEVPDGAGYLAVLRGGTTKAITLSLGKNVLVQKLELDPQTNGIIVDMLDHDEGVPVDTPPTIQHKKRFVVKNGAIVPR